MTEAQAISHARTFAKYFLLSGMKYNLEDMAGRFPDTKSTVSTIVRLIDDLILTVDNQHPDLIKPWAPINRAKKEKKLGKTCRK
jgi:hypothetical protein